jgi:aldehyde dehydrogenase (NAD+)
MREFSPPGGFPGRGLVEWRRLRGGAMKNVIERQRRFFQSGKTLEQSFRREQLKRLKLALQAHEGRLLDALSVDLGKAAFEGYATELGLLHEEINFSLRRLGGWMKAKRVPTPFVHFPSSSRIVSEPLGVVLIMSPWNYPLQLTIAPLIAAISAGDCSAIKPSRYSPATSAAMETMIREYFDPEYVSFFQGGSETNTALLAERFDHIFFTGSTTVGKVVMEAAAKHLTPVSLELGGKSPCIVDETARIDVAAKRIAWGKCVNSGQTCVAPDYLLVQSSVKDRLLAEIKKNIVSFYGKDCLANPEYPKIINQKHFDRLSGLLASGSVYSGGRSDAAQRKIEPTILEGVTLDSPIMKEEIFGPILPVIEFKTLDEAIAIIRKFEKPLALYLFSRDAERERRVLKEVSFGGGCVNDTLVHLSNPNLPFGGVGYSGMGAYHGYRGFEAFSHFKSVLKKSALIDVPVRYPPYKGKMGLLKLFMK